MSDIDPDLIDPFGVRWFPEPTEPVEEITSSDSDEVTEPPVMQEWPE